MIGRPAPARRALRVVDHLDGNAVLDGVARVEGLRLHQYVCFHDVAGDRLMRTIGVLPTVSRM